MPEPASGDFEKPSPSAHSVTTAEPPHCPTRTREYRRGEVVAEGFPAEQISDVLAADADSVVWLDLFDPDERDLQIVVNEFGLHPLTVEDAVHDHQRPKIDRYKTHLFVNVYAVAFDETTCAVTTAEISMFVTPRALITVRKSEFDVDTLIERWDLDASLASENTVGFLLYGLLDAVVDGHFVASEELEDLAERLEDSLFEARTELNIRQRCFQLRRASADLRRVVAPMHEVVGRLMRSELGLVNETLAPYFHDVLDHVQRVGESVDSTRDLVASILEANLNERATSSTRSRRSSHRGQRSSLYRLR